MCRTFHLPLNLCWSTIWKSICVENSNKQPNVPTLPFYNISCLIHLNKRIKLFGNHWWKLPQEKLLNSSSLLRTSRIQIGRNPITKNPKMCFEQISENAVQFSRPNWNNFTPVVYPQRNKNKDFVDLHFTIYFLLNGVLCSV